MFSVIIPLIASLGIIGLISFTTIQKKKEIAVRKVLGSSLKAIIWLLSRRFLVLMVFANLVALPVTYLLINEWLGNFTYRIPFHIWPFAVGLLVCASFTILSLLYHALLAAMANPIEALKSE